jgi:DNA-binding response OmpR family regulator
MTVRALFLSDTTQKDQALAQTVAKFCDELQIASTLAQATAAISRTLSQRNDQSFSLIVADVSAGGIPLTEYVQAVLRQNAYRRSEVVRPAIVLIDAHGDVASARRALQLGVDEYLLRDDLRPTTIDTVISRLIHTDPSPVVESHSTESTRGAAIAGDMFATQEPVDDGRWSARLSSVEAAIVNCLSSSMGSPMSARSIVQSVMGRDMDEDRAASLIRPHISRLRSKVEPMPQMPQRLLTVRGKGYMFVC